jgi:hypothetical protein
MIHLLQYIPRDFIPSKLSMHFLSPASELHVQIIYVKCSSLVVTEEEDAGTCMSSSAPWSTSVAR